MPPGLFLALALAAAAPSELDSVLRHVPADQLVAPLRRFEVTHADPRASAEAALRLGQLHYARGEYDAAAEAFARAAARAEPARKPEARYWEGLAWLALREPGQARARLEEVARGGGAMRDAALLGVAFAWEQTRRPDRALDVLEQLVDRGRGEAMPAALERAIALGERHHRDDLARRARARLFQEYPRSVEAARANLAPPPEPDARGAVAVQIGSFSAEGRAWALVRSARRAKFSEARVLARSEPRGRVYVVQLGVYPDRAEARRQGEAAARALGVEYRLVAP